MPKLAIKSIVSCTIGILVLAMIMGCQSGDGAQSEGTGAPDLQRRLEAYLSQSEAGADFSGVVVVGNGERLVVQSTRGMADRESQVPNTLRTKFCIASVGKMFTAVAIAQLAESGDLRFTDTVGQYVSGFPDNIADTVTIAQLLTHTAGMGNVALARAPGQPEPPTSIDAMMARIVAAPLVAEPGTEHRYSNDGFIVLGAIIESVTGERYAEFVQTHVFTPAGMVDTEVAAHCPGDVQGAAIGYRDGSSRPGGVGDIGSPSGGAASTAIDLVRFADALLDAELLTPEMLATVLAGKVDTGRNGAERDQYGYGFSDRDVDGVRVVGHGGGNPEYEGQVSAFPEDGYVAVVLANQGQTGAGVMRWLEYELATG